MWACPDAGTPIICSSVYGNVDANGELWVANPVYKEILPKYT